MQTLQYILLLHHLTNPRQFLPVLLATFDVFYHGKAIHVAGDRTFDTWDTTIFNDEDFGIRDTLENWMGSIANHKLNTRDKTVFNTSEGDVAKYKSTLKVQQFGTAGHSLRTYSFVGAWPSALSTINLDWSTASEIEEFTCTWVYDSWTIGNYTSLPMDGNQGLFSDEDFISDEDSG